jgi:hypothetical protein
MSSRKITTEKFKSRIKKSGQTF